MIVEATERIITDREMSNRQLPVDRDRQGRNPGTSRWRGDRHIGHGPAHDYRRRDLARWGGPLGTDLRLDCSRRHRTDRARTPPTARSCRADCWRRENYYGT